MMKCSKVRAAENHSPSVKRKVCENNVNGRLLVTGHLSGMIGMIPTPTIYPRYTVLAKKDRREGVRSTKYSYLLAPFINTAVRLLLCLPHSTCPSGFPFARSMYACTAPEDTAFSTRAVRAGFRPMVGCPMALKKRRSCRTLIPRDAWKTKVKWKKHVTLTRT